MPRLFRFLILFAVVGMPFSGVGCSGRLSEEDAAAQSAGENDLGEGDEGAAPVMEAAPGAKKKKAAPAPE